MKKPHIIIILLTVLSMTSCNRGHGPDKQFLENENITLTVGGREKIRFCPDTWQLSYSEDNKQFRANNDTMSEFFILTCSDIPVRPGQNIKCSLKYTDGGIAVYKTGMQFEVQKIDDEGMVWLWCKKTQYRHHCQDTALALYRKSSDYHTNSKRISTGTPPLFTLAISADNASGMTA